MRERAVQFMMSCFRGEDESRDWAALLERASTGDVSAFEQVMLRTERLVLLTARRMLGNSGDAEEAAQEVFLRVYKYLHRFDRTKMFEPWLYRLTVNVCNDITSRRLRADQLVFQKNCEPAARSASPYDLVDADEQHRLIQSALDELPEKQRAAVVLRDLQGLSTSEVAQILKVSAATVRSHLSTARLRMKRFIEKRIRRPM